MNIACVLSFVLAFCFHTLQAYAWNELCREAIESTAMSAITMDRLRRLKELLRGHDLVDYTWWPEEVKRRIPQSAILHKQPQSDNTCLTFDSHCPNGQCLIGATRFFFAKMMTSGYPVSRNNVKFVVPQMKYPKDIIFAPSDNLKYLVVLIADLHYPFNMDLIGEESVAQRRVNLSELPEWEAESIRVTGTTTPTLEDFLNKVYMPRHIEMNSDSWYGSWTNVEVLESRYKVEQESFNRNTWDNFEIWAADTANLNCAQLITKNDYIAHSNQIRMTEPLLEKIGTLLSYQIVLAGARIAIVLNYILSNREITYCSKTGMIIEKDPSNAFTSEDYWFMVLIMVIILIGLGFTYYFMLACKQMYNDNIRIHVDFAIKRMIERYRKRHKPVLDLQQK